MRLKILAACVAFLVASNCAAAEIPAFKLLDGAGHPLAGKIWSPAAHAFITPAQLTAQAAAADSVLLGETHDNPDHHALQAWVLQSLIGNGKKPLIAFEMFDLSQDEALQSYLAAHPKDGQGLGPALDWDKSGWPDWSHYAPIAQAALDAGLPISAANLSREQTQKAGKGALPTALRGYLNLKAPLPTDMRLAFEDDIRTAHCGMLPEIALPAMIRIQRARDASMAAAVDQAPQSVLIAGSGHVRKDRAAPWVLEHHSPKRRIFALAFLEVQPEWDAPAAYGEYFGTDELPFDAIWFTPKAPREDPCEAFRKHMDSKKQG